MIYDYQNQYWDKCPLANPRPKVTVDQHLAWPETRIGNLLTWLDRDDIGADGWSDQMVTEQIYLHLEKVSNLEDEAHF